MQFGDKHLPLTKPRVMGILNTTPDSFSDGGEYNQLDTALRQVESMLEHGADIVDIGGESTRPGAKAVSQSEELERTIPIIAAVKARFDTVVSIDTSKAQVMQEAVNAGAGLINDVRALREPGALEIAAQCYQEHETAVCLMHMQGQPRSMQTNPSYEDVTKEVAEFLLERANACEKAGIRADSILLDPGFGFGKSLEHNFELLAKLSQLNALGYPLLVGMSRKSMLGKLLNIEVSERLAAGISAHLIAIEAGASIIRVHDVKAHVDALRVLEEVQRFRES